MKLAIMQPYFFPYIGYFQLMNTVDLWVAFDDIQFIDKGWINRNRILHPDINKEWQFITLPLSKRGQFDKICDISIKSDINWREQILGKLTSYKKKAPNYNSTIEFVRDCFDTQETNLARLVIDILKKTAKHLEIETEIKIQSEMNLELGEIHHPGQWALRISESLGATEYINPKGGAEIFNSDEFRAKNTNLTYLKAGLNPYSQRNEKFVPALSILDVLMWCSISDVREQLNCLELVDSWASR